MPIRMEEDAPREPRRNQPQEPKKQNSGGGAIQKFIPFILMFLFKRPKFIIPALVVGAVWYFFLGGGNMFSGGDSVDNYSDLDNTEFSFGATFDQAKYDQTQVFEPLAASSSGNRLPAATSLIKYAPSRKHQGRQGSCVGWASAYSARTILEARATGKNPNSLAFSPSFLYNQIALSGCQGAYMKDAMESMRQSGAVPFSNFAYDQNSCQTKPGRKDLQLAQGFKIKGYNRLTQGANKYKPDINGIKQHLAQGAPVVIGMKVGGTFMSRMVAQDVWRPNQQDYSQRGYSGHAMSVIGYDDKKSGGAFQIMNSWGERWGNKGVAWVTYKDFDIFVKEAYGLYPMGDSPKMDKNKFAIKFGLVDNKTSDLIPLRTKDKRNKVFGTKRAIAKGDKFKVAVTNSIECYIYVFGQETDGSSYVLFPYTTKHSPYCGITGTRVFPRDFSMVADDIGTNDKIAIVVTKEAIDYKNLNQSINNSRQRSYSEKLQEALGNQQVAEIDFDVQDAVEFITPTKGKNAVGMVIEIDKR